MDVRERFHCTTDVTLKAADGARNELLVYLDANCRLLEVHKRLSAVGAVTFAAGVAERRRKNRPRVFDSSSIEKIYL